MENTSKSHRLKQRTLTNTSSACARCKVKKLKCDSRPKACWNCFRAKEECITVDAFRGREYPRGYVDDLRERAEYLKAFIKEPSLQQQGLRSCQSSSGGNRNSRPADNKLGPPRHAVHDTFNGDGSITSLGQKVAAEVSRKSFGLQKARLLGNALIKEQCTLERINASRADMPTPSEAQLLLDSYLNGPHVMHPFLKRGDIYDQLRRLYENQPNYHSYSNDIFQINMIFAIGAISLSRLGLHSTSPADYYVTAMEQADIVLGLSEDVHIQNTLLILLFGLHHDIGIGHKWDFARLSMQICVEKGYHKQPKTPIHPMVEQMQRRMFWCSYVSERHSSSFLGRPVIVSDSEISVELPMEFNDTAIESGTFIGPTPGTKTEVSILIRQILLRKITSEVRTQLYSAKKEHSFRFKEETVQRLISDLEKWRNTSPIFPSPETPYETSPYLELQFHRERMSLFRGLALAPKSEISATNDQYLRNCLDAAVQVVSAYQALSSIDKLVMNWTCVNDMLSSGFMVLYCSIHLERPTGDSGENNTAWHSDLSMILDTINVCGKILSHISTTWKSVEYHLTLFERLSMEVSAIIQNTANNTQANSPDEQSRDIHYAQINETAPHLQTALLENGFRPPPLSSFPQDAMMWDQSYPTLPVEGFAFSEADLNEIFGHDFQELNWEWDFTSSTLQL